MQWICNIALFMVFSGILLELIADTKYYKFARWVAGVILLLQFIKPLTSGAELGEKFEAVFGSFNYALGADKVLEELYQVDNQTENSVLQEYKETLSVQIERILRKNGLLLESAEIFTARDGTLTELKILAGYQDGTDNREIRIDAVEPVVIGEETKKTMLSPMELYIQETLAEFYQMEKNKIEVVIQEAQ